MTYIEKLAESIFQEVNPSSPLPEKERSLYLIYAVLALTVGEEVTRQHVHDAWAAWKALSDPSHRSLKPFWELTPEVQAEDDPFVNAIRRVATDLKRTA